MSLEANFGDNPAKPFEYDINSVLEWDWNGFEKPNENGLA
jgi:hypothetical protein